MASVTLSDVQKTYPNGHVAARDLDLEIADGEFVVLVGPSGCGKSTALRLVAGLETPTGGTVRIGTEDVTDRPPQERNIAMVFQNYALYPHMTVGENLAFGLRMRGTDRAEIQARVESAAGSLGLAGMLDRKPSQLSGGQRQRVALGRAIVRDPAVFLFDEPLSNLDAKLRVRTRAELARLHRRIGATMIYVTHDQEEAMTLGNRVAVMRDGTLQQVAPSMEVYLRPANVFVAGFVGSPAMNFFPCERRTIGGRPHLVGPDFELGLDDGGEGPDGGATGGGATRSGRAPSGGGSDALILGVRPQDIEVVGPDAGDLRARVDVIEPLGSELLIHLRREVGGPSDGEAPGAGPTEGGAAGEEEDRGELRALVPPESEIAVDDVPGLRFRRDRLHLFDAGTGRRVN